MKSFQLLSKISSSTSTKIKDCLDALHAFFSLEQTITQKIIVFVEDDALVPMQ